MIDMIIIFLFIVFLLIIIFMSPSKNNLLVKGLIDDTKSNMLVSLKYGFVFNYNHNSSYLLLNTKINSNNLSVFDINYNTIKNLTLTNNKINQTISYNNKKLVIFIRHARSISNNTKNYLIRNTGLCQRGYEQSEQLAEKLFNFNDFLESQTSYSKGIELAIISPLKRTLLTAVPTLKRLPKIEVETSFLCTETAFSPSSTGFSTVEEFKEFNNSVINRKIKVNEDEYNKWSKLIWKNYIADIISVHERKKLFNEFIRSRNEKVIIVFSHGDFLKLYFDYILDDNINYGLSLDNTHFIPVYF